MSKKEKGLSVVGTFDLKNTTGILDKLDEALAKLKMVEESPYKTSGDPDLSPFGNIKTELKIENLVKLYSSIKIRATAYGDAMVDLGIETLGAFTQNGGTLDDWKHDIKLRMDIVNYQDRYNKLKEAKEKLRGFLSEEEQKLIILKSVAETLNLS